MLFPLLNSNLCRNDMKRFVVGKPKDANGRFVYEMRTMPAVCVILIVRDGLLSILSCQINSSEVFNCCTLIN